MTHRFVGSVTVLMVLLLATLPVGGQAPPAGAGAKAQPAAKAYKVARTPDGQPDLEGYWTNSTYVPLERPNSVTKEFYTPEEAIAAEKRAAQREEERHERPGTEADVHYDFTQFGLDRSQSSYSQSLRTSLIFDPADGKIPPVTADGQKRTADRAAATKMLGGRYDAVQNMDLSSRCVVEDGSGPPMLSTSYNSNYQIVQGSGYVMILTEMIHDARIIPLDGRPHLPSTVGQWGGDSRGKWEGDTLVVQTTNFSDKYPFKGASPKMRVVERFTRTSADTIKYVFTVEDEATWARPWSAEMLMKKTIGPIFEFACHETNRAVANILAGARAEEKRVTEAPKKGEK